MKRNETRRRGVSPRALAGALAAAILCTLGSTLIEGTTFVTYADIDPCVAGCDVVAVGFPMPFVADYPGLSPVNSASLIDGIFGLDRILPGALAVSALFWLVACSLVPWLLVRFVKG